MHENDGKLHENTQKYHETVGSCNLKPRLA